MRPITNDLKEKIKINIKNKIDISSLIEDVDIKGMDLSWAIISKFRRLDSNLSGCNFSHCILGSDIDIFTLIRCNISNCNFDSANFIGKSWMRSCNAQNCNFKNSNVANVSYEHTNFKGSTFCGAIIKIGTRENVGSWFDKSLLEDLTKAWANKIEIKEIN